MTSRLPRPCRYGVSDRRQFPNLEVDRYLELLFETSADVIQWREKDLPAEDQVRLIRKGKDLSRQTGRLFLVNSLMEIALEERAGGVHLTSAQSVSRARSLRTRAKQPKFLLGKSVHSLREAWAAQATGADYLLLGPILAPISKDSTTSPLGLETLREAANQLSIPVLGIGGMIEENFQAVLETGAAGAAGISWVVREIRALHSGRHPNRED